MGLQAARLLETLNRQREQVQPDLNVSFEFFPPNTPEMAETLWQSVVKLARFKPRFVSVTYGAGASTRDRTHAVIERLAQNLFICPSAVASGARYGFTPCGKKVSAIDSRSSTRWRAK